MVERNSQEKLRPQACGYKGGGPSQSGRKSEYPLSPALYSKYLFIYSISKEEAE